MSAFSPGLLGAQAPNELFVPDTTQRHELGQRIRAIAPGFGSCEFIYLKATPAIATVGNLCTWDENFTAVVNPVTANTGRPVAVNRAPMVDVSYGWFQTLGLTPLNCPTGVAGPIYQAAGTAGQGTTTLRAGAQILGASARIASAGTFTRQGTTQNGSKVVKVPHITNMFKGLAVSGTGIAASSVIDLINPSGTEITLNNAATATGTVTLTFTYTGFVLAQIEHPHVQGNIT